MAKKNCKSGKESEKDKAKYFCEKCSSLAKDEKHLCKPKAIKKINQ